MSLWLSKLVAAWMVSLFGGVPDGLPEDVPSADDCPGVDLVAAKEYDPSTWFDSQAVLTESVVFVIPDSIPVTEGNAGNHATTLTFSDGVAAPVVCTYLGGSSQAHPSSATEIDLGMWYHFDHCDNGQGVGEHATADDIVLSISNGDSDLARTEVALILDDVSCALGPGPCAGDSWGAITWLGQTVHVRVDGDDSNSGDEAAPVATLGRALEITRSWGAVGSKAIAVGPGEFEAGLLLDEPEDDSTWVMGCSAEQTTLTTADPATPVLDLAMNGELGVRGVTLLGGSEGLAMRDGALAFADEVVVAESGVGVAIDDLATVAVLHEVVVDTPSTDLGCGWGIRVWDGDAMMAGVTVLDATEAGIVSSDGAVIGFDLHVENTAPRADGMLGRGFHAQDAWTFLFGGQFTDNSDAALFLLDPEGGLINGIAIDFTGAGVIAAPETTGDGIVIVGQLSTLPFLIIDNVVSDNDRAGILVEDSDVFVQDNKGGGNLLSSVLGGEAFIQGGVATGPQAPQVQDISASPIELYRDPLSCL